LAQEPFIRLDRNVFAGQLIDGYLRRAGIRLGVSLLPDWAPPWPEGLSLRKLQLPDRSLHRRTGLLWTGASLRVRLIHAFLEQAQLALGKNRKQASARKRHALP
jgi:DNA-binding transcriptional LysR family regulator